MKLKLLKPYQMSVAGDIVDFDRGVAELLIARRVAEPYAEQTKNALRPKRTQQDRAKD